MVYKVIYGTLSATNIQKTREFGNRIDAERFAETTGWYNLYRKNQNETCVWLSGGSKSNVQES